MTDAPRIAEILYHTTHRKNRVSIDAFGLVLHKARKSRRIWLADHTMLPWSLTHVAETQGWQLDDLITIPVLSRDLAGSLSLHRAGVYWSLQSIKPWHFVRDDAGSLKWLALRP